MALMTAFLPILSSLIERVFPDKIEQDKAKARLLELTYQAKAEEYKAKSAIVTAEARGQNWLQRNWRPVTMMVFLSVIILNYILAPLLGAVGLIVPTVPIAPEMWTGLTVGIGGYIVGRSGEKITTTKFNAKAYFDAMRELHGPLSQDEVNKHKEALKNAKD